jgi:hypothetical protein
MELSSDGLERAAGWLSAWDAIGTHRTATAGDAAGAQWLADMVAQLGAVPVIESYGLERLDPITAFVEFDGRRIHGVPVFDAPATPAGGIEGRLGLPGSGAEIEVVALSPHAVYSPDYEALRRDQRHAALIIVCAGARPGLALLNAERFRTPFGAPAVQVPSDAHDLLWAAALAGAKARMVVTSHRSPARAANVVVAITGREPQHSPVVVMTPRSSWWQSTAERGGGIVCWLETLRALLATKPAPNVVFTANSGHELGHLGLDDFLARRSGWEQPIAAGGAVWVHYGANIGAASGALSVMSADPDFAAFAAGELARAGHPPERIAPPEVVPSGETRDIHRAGGRYVTLVGSNLWFHHPGDRWPEAVDVAAIAGIAAGAAAWVVALTR